LVAVVWGPNREYPALPGARKLLRKSLFSCGTGRTSLAISQIGVKAVYSELDGGVMQISPALVNIHGLY